MKKSILALAAFVTLGFAAFTGCGDSGEFNPSREINVITREDGSGTRDAFVELLDIRVTADGVTRDMTSPDAEIAPATNLVISRVEGNTYAIGYISLGSLNDSVRALHIDGVAPTAANIFSGTYPLFRPFYLATQHERDALTQEFLNFVLSAEGQAVVSGRGYVPAVDGAPAYHAPSGLSGTVVVSGSTSIESLMLRLKEAFEDIHPNVTIEVHSGGTGVGITATVAGTANIGMASRALRDSEIAQGLEPIAIAYDGVVVIVNPENPTTNISQADLRSVFVGDTTRWESIAD